MGILNGMRTFRVYSISFLLRYWLKKLKFFKWLIISGVTVEPVIPVFHFLSSPLHGCCGQWACCIRCWCLLTGVRLSTLSPWLVVWDFLWNSRQSDSSLLSSTSICGHSNKSVKMCVCVWLVIAVHSMLRRRAYVHWNKTKQNMASPRAKDRPLLTHKSRKPVQELSQMFAKIP